MLWFGANDVIGAIVATPTATPESVAAAAVGAATAVADGIGTLRGLGVQDVVVLNLPSLDSVPLFTSAPAGAAALAGLGSDRLQRHPRRADRRDGAASGASPGSTWTPSSPT